MCVFRCVLFARCCFGWLVCFISCWFAVSGRLFVCFIVGFCRFSLFAAVVFQFFIVGL